MKKRFALVLLAVLAVALFVSCKDKPELISACTVTFSGSDTEFEQYFGTYYLKGGDGENDSGDCTEYYRLYTDSACTNLYTEDAEEYFFCINMRNGMIDDVQVPGYYDFTGIFSNSPEFDLTPVDGNHATTTFTAGSVFTGTDSSGTTLKLEFTKDVTLVCYIYD